MTKLLTIDVNFDKSQNDIIYSINVIANDQENILILKDVLDDQLRTKNYKCIGVKLYYCLQHSFELLPPICAKGQIYVRVNGKMPIDSALSTIEQTILHFIL